MKRITHLKINNYRAFFGDYEISIPKGENLLIYGENGSGKSSIYRALKDFFASSENPSLQFWRNVYAPVSRDIAADGTIEVTFNNDPVLENSIGAIYNFSNIPSIRNAQTESFLKKANKAKAFLSYQELVKSYVVRKDEILSPNLYNLFIDGILGEFILPSGISINDKWDQLNKDFSIPDKRTKEFNTARKEIPFFENEVKEILRPILLQMNSYLSVYFKNDIQIDVEQFICKPVNNKSNWYVNRTFRLQTNLFNDRVNNGYQNHLNEARLSAIAICLYLAAIKLSPQPDVYKIVFLDDIFIGLDTSNRLPLLELLKLEFPDHQIFISTYDRFWYETAKRWFVSNMFQQWKFYEMYVNHREHLPGKIFDKPILCTVTTNWEKGIFYLQHEINPDYPASANSFRKFFEEILLTYIPEFEFRKVNNIKIEEFKLTHLCYIANSFLIKICEDNSLLLNLISSLPTLLHPLSHFNISSPLYKGELLMVRDNLLLFENQLKSLDLKNKYKNLLSKGKRVRIRFNIEPNHDSYYVLYLHENLCKNINSNTLSNCICNYIECFGIRNGLIVSPKSFKKTDKNFEFNSLQDAYLKTHSFLISLPNSGFNSILQIPDYLDACEYSNDGINWVSIKTIV